MFERFTERARQAVVLAGDEARALAHNHIGTEHILLGLLAEQQGDAAWVLQSLGIDIDQVRAAVVRIVGAGEGASEGQIPFTPRGKKVLELALREALSLGHNYIGTEHILLGIVRENDGVAANILLGLDADPEKVRNEVIRAASGQAPRHSPEFSTPTSSRPANDAHALVARLAPEIRDGLGRSPDRGDLLLVLASARSGVVGRALADLGITTEALRASIDRARAQAPDELGDQLDAARTRKDAAIEAGEIEEAQRALEDETRIRAELEVDPLDAARGHLGL
jgi:ATP-dependent Clp protease ATP-binding subunit ClpA